MKRRRMPSLSRPKEYKVGLVVSDDLKGGWTNRWASEFSHRFETKALPQAGLPHRDFSGPASRHRHRRVRDAVLTSIYRAEYLQRHPSPKTLHGMLEQEGYAMARAGCTTPALDADDLAYTRTVIEPHLDAPIARP